MTDSPKDANENASGRPEEKSVSPRDSGFEVKSKDSLVQRSKTQWLFGDWTRLAEIDLEALENHPERARLAMLRAAALFQNGKITDGRRAVVLALQWGCEKRMAARVLAAGVFNSLGRASAVSGQASRAYEHFRASVAIGAPDNDIELITRARISQQCWEIGLASVPEAAGRIAGARQGEERDFNVQLQDDRLTRDEGAYSKRAHAFYKRLSRRQHESEAPLFILLESKSIPRSGVHYMARTFESVLGKNFSFCEYYQEPGCCKKMPCTYTAYANNRHAKQEPALRLTKSHDFGFTDPVYPVSSAVRRVVLVRHPLFVLTSWYALETLAKYSKVLSASGIDMRKIWFLHEPEVLMAAYGVVDEMFVTPRRGDLSDWLDSKVRYLKGFIDKWVIPVNSNQQQYQKVLKYEQVSSYVSGTVDQLGIHTVAERQESKQVDIQSLHHRSFQARNDAFSVQSLRISEYLLSNSSQFVSAANEVVQYDWTGTLH